MVKVRVGVSQDSVAEGVNREVGWRGQRMR